MSKIALVRAKEKGGRPPIPVPAVKIEKNVPPPVVYPATTYPFGEMDVNDSFFVADDHPHRAANRLRAKLRYWRMRRCPRPQASFTVRLFDDGVRCWRTA